MSDLIIKNKNSSFTVYSSNIPDQLYISTYYTLTADNTTTLNNYFFIQFNSYSKSQHSSIDHFIVDFGDGDIQPVYPNDILNKNYSIAGTFFISYTSVYLDSTTGIYSNVNNVLLSNPIYVKKYWNNLETNTIRLNNQIILNLPYTFEQVRIQPNEWGVEDIFNTSMGRLNDCLIYLKNSLQTIDITTPTNYFGWLGNDSYSPSSDIKWSTQLYDNYYYLTPQIAVAGTPKTFNGVKDAAQINDVFYILDGNKLRFFQNSNIPQEISFSNSSSINETILYPAAFDVDKTGNTMFIVDSVNNRVYNLYLDFDNSIINIISNFGGFGSYSDHNKFNSPTEIRYVNENVYILDYNNYCIKQYNKNFNWMFTYFSSIFDNDRPVSFDVNPSNNLIYVLTKSGKVVIFENGSNTIYEEITINESRDNTPYVKLIFEDFGDFMYILTETNVYKYTSFGYYINIFSIPKSEAVLYTNIKKSNQKNILISSNNCIFKCQDILSLYKIGDGLSYNSWTKDQLMVKKDALSSDLVYNVSLVRMAQNIKSLREIINFKFGVLKQQLETGYNSYFTIIPVSKNDLPIFDQDIENETIGVGVNELHVPEVINKELLKLYNALFILADFLSIKNISTSQIECINDFCWSWKATSTYNLNLPIVKTCGINPISYSELNNNTVYQYAPTTTWLQASACCNP